MDAVALAHLEEREVRAQRVDGVGAGEPSCSTAPLLGVLGWEKLVLDRENISLGCETLYLMLLKRPPRNFLMKASSSRARALAVLVSSRSPISGWPLGKGATSCSRRPAVALTMRAPRSSG